MSNYNLSEKKGSLQARKITTKKSYNPPQFLSHQTISRLGYSDIPLPYADIKTRTVDIALAIGLTYNFTDRLDFYGRFSYGFLNYFKDYDGDRSNHLVLQFDVGYRLWGDEAFHRTRLRRGY